MTIDQLTPTATPADDDSEMFIDTRPLPEPEAARKNLARKRVFYLLVVLSLIVVGLIIWEIVDIIAGASL